MAEITFEEVPCVSCGEIVLKTGPRRVGRSGPFHVACPLPDRRRQGYCAACDNIYTLDPVTDLHGGEHWMLPVHWRPTKAQAAVELVTDHMKLWTDGQRMLSLPGGGVRCYDYDVLWQKDECPNSHSFAPLQWESYVSKGGRYEGPGVKLEPYGWAREQLEKARAT